MDRSNDFSDQLDLLNRGLRMLAVLASYPKGVLPKIVSDGEWFTKLRDFLYTYFLLVEPYWSTVENFIEHHRLEAYKQLYKLNDEGKYLLTFEQAFIYISSWGYHQIELEKFFQSIGLPPHIAFQMSKDDQESFYKALGDFEPSDFLHCLSLMHSLEIGEFRFGDYIQQTYQGQTYFLCIGSHLMDLREYKDLFKAGIDISESLNRVLNLIIKRLGISDIHLLLDGTPMPRRCRRGVKYEYVVIPENYEAVNSLNFANQNFQIDEIFDELSNRTKQNLPARSLFNLKNYSLELMDHILFQSVYLNQRELTESFTGEPGKFNYDFFPNSCGGYYNPLEDNRKGEVFKELLTNYLYQIFQSHNLVRSILPNEEFSRIRYILEHFNDNTNITNIKIKFKDKIMDNSNENGFAGTIDYPSESMNRKRLEYPTRIDSKIKEPKLQNEILSGLFNEFGRYFESKDGSLISHDDFLYLFSGRIERPLSYQPPYFWNQDVKNFAGLVRLLYLGQAKGFDELILLVKDKGLAKSSVKWSVKKQGLGKPTLEPIENKIQNIVLNVAGLHLPKVDLTKQNKPKNRKSE